MIINVLRLSSISKIFERHDYLLPGLAFLCGTYAALSSSFQLIHYPHGYILYPWEFNYASQVSACLSGIIVLIYGYIRPKRVLYSFIAIALFSSSFFVLRFPIMDEFLCLMLLLGVCISKKRMVVKVSNNFPPNIVIIFTAIFTYLTIMSLVGYIDNGNVKSIRLTLIFTSMVILSLLINNIELDIPNRNTTLLIVSYSGIYVYLMTIVNYYVAINHDFKMHSMEAVGFGGLTYTNFLNVLVVPCVAIIFALKMRKLYPHSIINVLLIIYISILGDSRGSLLPIIILVLFIPFIFKSIESLIYMLLIISVVFVVSYITYGHLHWISDSLDSMINSANIGGTQTIDYYGEKYQVAAGDTGRFIYVAAPIHFLSNNIEWLLTGVGSYGYFDYVGNYFEQISDQLNSSTLVINPSADISGHTSPSRPPMMGTYIAEYGLLGCAFISIYLIVFSIKLFKRFGTGNKWLNVYIINILPTCILYTYFSELENDMLLYLAIAPFGIVTAIYNEQ